MSTYKKGSIALIILIALVIGFYAYFKNTIPREQTQTIPQPASSINLVDKVNLPTQEKEQVKQAVDDFMSKYKLPKDQPTSYVLQIEKRLNNSLEVITDPDKNKSDTNTIIYLKKVNNNWQVDETAGPWCTLEEFEQNKCGQ